MVSAFRGERAAVYHAERERPHVGAHPAEEVDDGSRVDREFRPSREVCKEEAL